MTPIRNFLSIVALTTTTLAASALAAAGDSQDSHHPAQTAAVQGAQATPGGIGMSTGTPTPAHGEQMKAMQEMHEKMLSAKTPEERNALMAAHMTLMQNGMNMMNGMGGMGDGAMKGKPGDIPARQGMLEQRMDMMQSMMRMMMDRMQSVPATK